MRRALLTRLDARVTVAEPAVAHTQARATACTEVCLSTQSAPAGDTVNGRSAAAGRLLRLFVSSTFADLADERDALHNDVFPRLEALCAERGAHFQAVDLRWAVSEEASLDQQAVEICLEEIARCQHQTPRPNFVLLLGERYGWRPLPAWVRADELEAMRPHLEPEAAALVGSWYREDRNAVPAEYRLQPRAGEFAEEAVWEPLERTMRTSLAAAANEAGVDAKARRKYSCSVTEQEAVAGIFEAEDARGHVHCFFRTIVGLPDDHAGRAFRDEGLGRAELMRLKNELRAFLGAEHVHEYEVEWKDGAPSRDHLAALCDDVHAALSTVIESELERAEDRDVVDRERGEHDRFGAERRRHFVGRARPLKVVADYVTGDTRAPLEVVGASGVGKTAFIARAAAVAQGLRDADVIVRFIGVTDRAASLRTLLQDFLLELRRARGGQEDVPASLHDLVDAFREELAHDRPRRALLFVDALDQLAVRGEEVDLAWLPAELSPDVRIVVSAAEGPVAAALKRRLPQDLVVELEPLPDAEAGELLDAWLLEAKRTLQEHQRNEVMRAFAVHGLPLHLRLAFEEARRWPSYAAPKETRLADSVPGLIRDLFGRLAREENHGELLVARSLAFLAAARNGLSEYELLDLLSADDEVVGEFRRRSPRSPAVARIPDIVWSRLFSDLEPYLNERRADDRTLLGFYHRQLADVVAEEFLEGASGCKRHAALATYFARQELELGGSQSPAPNLRKLSELPFQQTHAALWGDLFTTLTDFAFLECKVAAFEAEERVGPDGRVTRTYPGVFLLQDDFELALRAWPQAER
jgi:hypothetical protein